MLRVVLLIGFIGHFTCLVICDPPSNWGPYPDSHSPAAEYGPPTTSNPPDSVYGAPPSTPSIQIEPETEYNGQITEITTPVHRPSYIYVSSIPSTEFGQLKKPNVSAFNSVHGFNMDYKTI